MRKTLTILLCALLLTALTGCGGEPGPPEEDAALTVAATTYPVYCFATAVTEGAQGVEVELLVNQQTSCLHDYTLTVNDMKLLEGADAVVMNGAGLEDFLSDAMSQLSAAVIDCSEGVELLPPPEDDGHGHDPHIWMDPARAAVMVDNIAAGLSALDGENAGLYADNAARAGEELQALLDRWSGAFDPQDPPRLITFHDGFGYLADAFGLDILRSIEEEEGSEVSARELAELEELIRTENLPAIFTEVNGSDASARALARDTGAEVYALSLCMSGEESGLAPYLTAIEGDLTAVRDAMGGNAP